MKLLANLGRAAAVLTLIGTQVRAQSATSPVQRVANIVSVAVEEYAKGIDARGRTISADEYQEAVGFLKDARTAAQRLPGNRALGSAILDSIIAAVNDKKSPAYVAELSTRFAASLGSEAALALPKAQIDVAEGRKLYDSTCASCHGVF